MGRQTNHIHVWKSLLEQAGFALGDIPKEWDAFWSFWCDEVQPAARKALGREDIWSVGLSMAAGTDAENGFLQFQAADGAQYVTHDGRLVIDSPEIRRKLIEVIDSYTAFYRRGCTPPDAVNWAAGERNNEAFLANCGDDRERIARRQRAQARPGRRLLQTPPQSNGLSVTGEPFPIEGSVSVLWS
jgi:multiple sugar transport system substrate-binding protein